MTNIETLTLGELETNCYLVWDENSKDAWIIDPADDGDYISQRLLELDLKPKKIILTHGHFDHVLGLLPLKLNFKVPILLHPQDNFLLKKAKEHAKYWLGREVDPVPPADGLLENKQVLSLGLNQPNQAQNTFTILHTPGHTPGSVCLVGDEVVFTGDTLFKSGLGRTDFSYSSPPDMIESLKKLAKLPLNLKVYAGHGEPTTIGKEKATLG